MTKLKPKPKSNLRATYRFIVGERRGVRQKLDFTYFVYVARVGRGSKNIFFSLNLLIFKMCCVCKLYLQYFHIYSLDNVLYKEIASQAKK